MDGVSLPRMSQLSAQRGQASGVGRAHAHNEIVYTPRLRTDQRKTNHDQSALSRHKALETNQPGWEPGRPPGPQAR